MRGQRDDFRIVVVEQGNLLAQRHGKKRRANGHADADAQSGARGGLRIERRALPQAEAHANRHCCGQRHRQDKHQGAEVERNLMPGDVHNAQRGDQQGDHGKQGHLKEQRKGNRQP